MGTSLADRKQSGIGRLKSFWVSEMVNIIVIFACGMFCICAAIFDWDFFFENYKARPVVDAFGRNGARIFYGICGLALIVSDVLIAFLWNL